MMSRRRPVDEAARLNALYRYDVLDTGPEEAFDRITRIAQTALETPIVLISLIDRHRQWFKSRRGFEDSETGREIAFCTHAIESDKTLVVNDTHVDPRFAQNLLVVNEPYIRFYAGVPLRTRDGHNIGTLCAMDTRVRELRVGQLRMLEDLSRVVVDALELRQLAAIDSLTGALTRRSFYEQARRDLDRSAGNGKTLSCAVIDIDDFKRINDTHGHATGDRLLQHVVSICKSGLRSDDYLGRIGGDEFALLLPDTLLLNAFEMADGLRKKIADTAIEISGHLIGTTVSIGIAESITSQSKLDGLLQTADSALYDAKLDGKNRVACHLADLKLESTDHFRRGAFSSRISDGIDPDDAAMPDGQGRSTAILD